MTEDAKRLASERRWFAGTCFGLIAFFCCLGYFGYSSRQAQLEIEADEQTRKSQLQAQLVAQVKLIVADPAYDGHVDQFPDSISPFMSFADSLRTAESFIEYELTPSVIEGGIHHLYNSPDEQQVLIRYLEKSWGKPWHQIGPELWKKR